MDIEVFLIYTKYQEIIKAEYSMNEMLSQILVTLISGMGASVALTDVLKMLFKKKKNNEPDISEKIERGSKTLSSSSAELTDLQQELEEKIQFVNDLNMKANQAQSLLSLSHDQIDAIKTMLNQETQKENRANFWKSVLVNFIFFVLGAIASYIISKYLV